jgi:SAM-dependent MidA family methyltransferase
MAADCRALILRRIRERGPMTAAEYMDLALYHPEHGYYARASRRTGRAGDFFTSVDVGPLFGELLAIQIAEMWRVLRDQGSGIGDQESGMGDRFDLVEAGAADGQLARDILDAMQAHDPGCCQALQLHLVERSAEARRGHQRTLGPHASRIRWSSEAMPARVDGVILANELLDALPTHLVEMSPAGLREVYVDADGDRLVERLADVSSPQVPAYFAQGGIALEPGWRAEVNLAAVAWAADAARRLGRGFMILIDYGHQASDLYSAAHAAGTLTSFVRHTSAGPEAAAGLPPWLAAPGDQDLTAHVDLTSIVRSVEREGLATLAMLDQTYFLLGLGLAERLGGSTGDERRDLARRLALKTLMMPGGLGSTHKVLIFGKGVGKPALLGCSFSTRVT